MDYEKTIERKQRAGFGQGSGINYQAWPDIINTKSVGLTNTWRGLTIDRPYIFFSELERSACIILDFNKRTTDIQEQFPLFNRSITQQIASELAVKHPHYPGTAVPVVMTTDLIITYIHNNQERKCARTVKPSRELENLRTIEKLAIEREYWHRTGITDYKIVTEKEINFDLVKNIENISMVRSLNEVRGLQALTEEQRLYLYDGFLDSLKGWEGTLRELTMDYEREFALVKGVGMDMLRLAILQENFKVNLDKPLNFDIAVGEL